MPLHQTQISLGPEFTPKVIRLLLWLTGAISLLVAQLDPYLPLSLNSLLGLSWHGFQKHYFWQPLTFLFVQTPTQGLTFGLLFNLAIQLYLLWIIGSDIVTSYDPRSFLTFYFLSGIVCGLAGWFALTFTPQFGVYGGSYATFFSLFVVWTMMHPTRELLFLILFPIQLKILFASLLIAVLLISISQGDLLSLSLVLAGTITGYFFGLFVWQLHSPYQILRPLDTFFESLFKKRKKSSSKIIDIHTGRSLEKRNEKEDQFIDEMLEKISKEGSDSLSWWQRRKLNKITSKRKKK